MESEPSRVMDALPGLVWAAIADDQTGFLNQHWRGYTGLRLRESDGWLCVTFPLAPSPVETGIRR